MHPSRGTVRMRMRMTTLNQNDQPVQTMIANLLARQGAYGPTGWTVRRSPLKKFEGFDLDGLRTDLEGKIFVTRPGNGTVAVLAPDGTLVLEIPLRGKQPSNLTFGGPDGHSGATGQRLSEAAFGSRSCDYD